MIIEVAAVAVSVVSAVIQRSAAQKVPPRPFDFRAALIELHEQLHDWSRKAHTTNLAVHSWVQAGMPSRGETAEYVVSCQISQGGGGEHLRAQLRPQPQRGFIGRMRPPSADSVKLVQFLEIYAPDLAAKFIMAADERQDDLTHMFVTLRRLRECCPEGNSIQEYLSQLDTSSREIKIAATDLAGYIRQNFPPGAG